MRRTISRRAWFFAVLSAIGLAFVYPTPADYRGAPWLVFGLGLVWAVLFAIEDLTTPRYRPRDKAPAGQNPFAPPPPPTRPGSPGRTAGQA